MSKIIKNIRYVINQRKYSVLFLIVSISTFFLLYFLTLATTSGHNLGIFAMMNGFWYTVITFSIFVVFSSLLGLYAMLAVYKFRLVKKPDFKANASGFAGFSAGLLGAGCPMCGALILGLFGAPLALLLLPFRGLELRLLSAALLLVSVSLLSKGITNCEKCRR